MLATEPPDMLADVLPILGAARGAHGEQHDLQVGGAAAIAPFASRGPPNTFYYL